MKVAAVVPAAGRGERAGLGFNKIFASLRGEPVITHTLRALENCADISSVVLVAQPADADALEELTAGSFEKVHNIVLGGPRRQDSVARGLAAVDADARVILIHDAARPLVTPELLSKSIRVCRAMGSAVAAVPVSDTIKQADQSRRVVKTLERRGLWSIQTPQTFQRDLIQRAYERGGTGPTVSDDAYLVELVGEPVHLIYGSRLNIKITVAEDLLIAEALLAFMQASAASAASAK